jgi:hypothetical protein
LSSSTKYRAKDRSLAWRISSAECSVASRTRRDQRIAVLPATHQTLEQFGTAGVAADSALDRVNKAVVEKKELYVQLDRLQ